VTTSATIVAMATPTMPVVSPCAVARMPRNAQISVSRVGDQDGPDRGGDSESEDCTHDENDELPAEGLRIGEVGADRGRPVLEHRRGGPRDVDADQDAAKDPQPAWCRVVGGARRDACGVE